MITENELNKMEERLAQAQAKPWIAFVEGRDHESGSNFIRTGESDARGQDLEIIGATIGDYDFIAHAREDIPKLIAEIRRLRKFSE